MLAQDDDEHKDNAPSYRERSEKDLMQRTSDNNLHRFSCVQAKLYFARLQSKVSNSAHMQAYWNEICKWFISQSANCSKARFP